MALVHVCIFAFALPMIFAVQEASVQGTQAHEQHSVSPSGKLLAADGSQMHSADVAGGSTLMRRHAAQPSAGMSEDHMFEQPSALSDGFQGTMRSLQSQIAAGSALEIGDAMRNLNSHIASGSAEALSSAGQAPSGYTSNGKDCGAGQNLKSVSVSKNNGLEECAKACSAETACVGFSFHANPICILKKGGADTCTTNSGWTFYKKAAPYVKAAPAPIYEIADGFPSYTFEKYAGTKGPTAGSCSTNVDVQDSGKNSLQACVSSCASTSSCKWVVFQASGTKCFTQQTTTLTGSCAAWSQNSGFDLYARPPNEPAVTSGSYQNEQGPSSR